MKVTAQARRTGDWWADAVALLEDVDPATVEVDVVPEVPYGRRHQ